MKSKRWLREKDPTRLMLKLNEEVGEVTHAFMREDDEGVLAELDDVRLIADCLGQAVLMKEVERESAEDEA